ncbi:melatonin receptor type 1C-like [Protopterus annectens]|uniref:melatonin receptor type 1C-like n=1 Tax=Protopterus annectens TaxID=7888 RepID=UPI001CFAB52F|nr:melatonin receptor type 1C-like [Protopterus annectens]
MNKFLNGGGRANERGIIIRVWNDRGFSYSSYTDYSSRHVAVFLTVVMIFVTVMDILGNILVILSIIKNKKLRNAGNAFVISLSVADLMVGIYPYPLVTIATLQRKWTLGDIQCKAAAVIQDLGLIVSVYNIMAIAINRYCCICYSLRYDKLYSMKNTCCYVFLLWIFCIILTLPIAYFDVVKYDERIHICVFSFSVNPSLTCALAILHFLVPVTTVVFCYSKVWMLVIQVKYRVRQGNKQKLKRNEVRHFLTMFASFILFAVFWSPFSIPALVVGLSPKGNAPKFPDWLYVLGYFAASFNSCLNGIVYGIFNQNFRDEYKRILQSFCTFPKTIQ